MATVLALYTVRAGFILLEKVHEVRSLFEVLIGRLEIRPLELVGLLVAGNVVPRRRV